MLSLLQITLVCVSWTIAKQAFHRGYGPNYKRRPLWLPISVAVMLVWPWDDHQRGDGQALFAWDDLCV